MLLIVKDEKLDIEYKISFKNANDMISFFSEFNPLRFDIKEVKIFEDVISE